MSDETETDGTVTLTSHECTALAWWLVLRRLDDMGEWASWDLVPELTEDQYLAVLTRTADWRNELVRALLAFELRHSVVAVEIARRVS